jgi:Lar family restriction alleviation protein
MTILKEKLRCRYSGKNSEQFWKKINNLPEAKKDEIYLAAVILQNTEGSVLKALNNINQEELKPCPFCGKADYLKIEREELKYYIKCNKCDIRGPYGESAKAAMYVWNERLS